MVVGVVCVDVVGAISFVVVGFVESLIGVVVGVVGWAVVGFVVVDVVVVGVAGCVVVCSAVVGFVVGFVGGCVVVGVSTVVVCVVGFVVDCVVCCVGGTVNGLSVKNVYTALHAWITKITFTMSKLYTVR